MSVCVCVDESHLSFRFHTKNEKVIQNEAILGQLGFFLALYYCNNNKKNAKKSLFLLL